ncbi:MAG: hypothetical protein IK080_01350 [Clostridia bacterium]|nr:hypothetical protein [Clostridia bacterium]
METNNLFQTVENGYNCADVDEYISVIKAEYKKVFDYAKGVEANNEKLKKICRALNDENKALKANGAVAAPAAAPVAVGVDLLEELTALDKIGAQLAAVTGAIREKAGQ